MSVDSVEVSEKVRHKVSNEHNPLEDWFTSKVWKQREGTI
jgi:hypothetical protein